jgi:PPOX class probable F420-dependent enzyme
MQELMSVTPPEDYKDLLERPIVAALGTLMPDSQPQVTPVWFSYDGQHIWVNTARKRQKDRNMTERPQVTLTSIDPDDPYRYLEVRGVVEEVTEEGALDHINSLSARYVGREDYYSGNPSMRGKETRVIYKIKPVRFSGH